MDIIYKIFLAVHMTAGFIGLAAYWIPIFSRKGAVNHRRFGKVFVYAGYVVVVAAVLSIGAHAAKVINSGVPFNEAQDFWGLAIFLSYLALITFAMIRFGMLVLTEKKDPTRLATATNKMLGIGMIVGSLAVITYALTIKPQVMIVLLALSPIGLFVGPRMLRYFGGARAEKRGWYYSHMGIMIGAGIAFHTAFLVFGMSRLIDIGLTGPFAFVPWVLPTLIGLPANMIWERHYRNKFGDTKPAGGTA